jgi:hypothetical protein
MFRVVPFSLSRTHGGAKDGPGLWNPSAENESRQPIHGSLASQVETHFGWITPPSHSILHFGNAFFNLAIPAAVTFVPPTASPFR